MEPLQEEAPADIALFRFRLQWPLGEYACDRMYTTHEQEATMTAPAMQAEAQERNGGSANATQGTQSTSAADTGNRVSSTHAPEKGIRTMPDQVRKHVITLRDGKHYLPSAFRVLWFRLDHPDWSIITELIEGGFEAGWATVRASVLADDGRVIATGMKTESKGDFPAGWVEKAETGAVGRALAMAGYGTQFAPELYEEDETPRSVSTRAPSRPQSQPVRRTPTTRLKMWNGPGLCPNCHAPEGKPHAKACADPR